MEDKVKAKIIELCPDVKSDTRGYQQIQLNRAYQDYLDICKEVTKEDSGRTFASAAMAFDRVKKLSNVLAVFQDVPITLAVVLRAINNVLVIVDAWGNIYKMSMKLNQKYPMLDPENGTERWNLKHDNYDQQSEECKQFIGQLLGV